MGTIDAKRDFFISFTGADRPWARWLARVLTEEGYTYWFQDQDFAGSIPGNIERAQAQSQRTIVLLSEAYARSGYCRSEWEMRYQEDPGAAKDLIVPFRLGPCDPGPLLCRLAYSDLFTCQDEDSAREEVRQRLRQAAEPGYRRPLAGGEWPGPRPADTAFPVPDHNLPRLIGAFVGRTAELKELHEALTIRGRSAITQAITGLGGIGKTQLALNYAYAHLADYDLIRWLRAEEPATLAADYTGLAPALGLLADTPDQAALITTIRARLERAPRWLLIFDNATTPATLDPYMPRLGSGHVLITSRLQDWGDTAQPLELEVLPESDAVAMLVGATATPAERSLAAELARDLGRLPLALAQAQAFMRARRIGVAAYREQLAQRRRQVMTWRPPNAAYSLSLAQAWQASVEHAAADCAAARPLLELLAFLAPDAIPRDLLGADPEALPESLRDPFERDTAIAALLRFSLVRADSTTLSVHRLVQAVTRDDLDESRAKARAGTAVRLALAAMPSKSWEHENWPLLRALLPHALAAADGAEALEADLESVATLLNRVAGYHRGLATWSEAEPLLQRAIAIGEKTLGPEHPDLASGLNNLAALYWDTGRYAEAEPLYQRAIAIGEKTLGPEHPDLATRLNNLANLYQDTGRYAEAEPLLQRAIAIGEKALGPEHPDLAIRLNNLAGLYRATGRYAEAEPLFQRAVTILEKALPPNHPNLHLGRHNYASLLDQLGRKDEARALRAKAEAARR